MKIREATLSDISAITDIYNEVILKTNAIYRESQVNPDDRVKWFNQRVDSGYPVIVAEINGEIVGYGAFNDFRFGEDIAEQLNIASMLNLKTAGMALVE